MRSKISVARVVAVSLYSLFAIPIRPLPTFIHLYSCPRWPARLQRLSTHSLLSRSALCRPLFTFILAPGPPLARPWPAPGPPLARPCPAPVPPLVWHPGPAPKSGTQPLLAFVCGPLAVLPPPFPPFWPARLQPMCLGVSISHGVIPTP